MTLCKPVLVMYVCYVSGNLRCSAINQPAGNLTSGKLFSPSMFQPGKGKGGGENEVEKGMNGERRWP